MDSYLNKHNNLRSAIFYFNNNNPSKFDLWFKPYSTPKKTVDIIYLFGIIYSLIALPFYVSYRIDINYLIIIIEIFIPIETILYIYLKYNEFRYFDNLLDFSKDKTIIDYLRHQFLLNFVGVFPTILSLSLN